MSKKRKQQQFLQEQQNNNNWNVAEKNRGEEVNAKAQEYRQRKIRNTKYSLLGSKK